MLSVLIIDDAEEVRGIIAHTLEPFGFEARHAADGLTGVRLVREATPSLILCDIRMPGIDGYQTLAAIRELPNAGGTPFIFLTGESDRKDLRRAMVSGADDYLTKPFTPEELLETVAARLAKQTETNCAIHRQAEKLRENIIRLLSREIVDPLDGIVDLTIGMMREHATLPPEKILANARQIMESAQRVNQLARSLK